jgi:hypothetical protein
MLVAVIDRDDQRPESAGVIDALAKPLMFVKCSSFYHPHYRPQRLIWTFFQVFTCSILALSWSTHVRRQCGEEPASWALSDGKKDAARSVSIIGQFL